MPLGGRRKGKKKPAAKKEKSAKEKMKEAKAEEKRKTIERKKKLAEAEEKLKALAKAKNMDYDDFLKEKEDERERLFHEEAQSSSRKGSVIVFTWAPETKRIRFSACSLPIRPAPIMPKVTGFI